MAVTRPTPKDIGNYEAKLIGPFTQRQTVCLGAGIIPSVIICWVLKTIGADTYFMIMLVMTIMIVPCILAFGKKFTYGQNPEDFVRDYIYYHVKSAPVRYYEVESYDDLVYKKILKDRSRNITKNVKREKQIEPGRETKYIDKAKYRTYIHRKDRKYNEL